MVPAIEKFSQGFISYFVRNKTAIFLTLFYAALISFISAHHEVWRDEVRALSIATDHPSLSGMFSALKNEGHPYLWYLILYFSEKVFHSPVVLKITHILIASGAIYIFLSRSPFDWLPKILFVLGYFPLYQYAVINRHYSLGMLFIFLLCALYRQRFEKSILYGIMLFLLANTTAHALIIALSVTAAWVIEYLGLPSAQKNTQTRFAVGSLTAIIGIFVSAICVWPDKTAAATTMYHLELSAIFQAIISTVQTAVTSPGNLFPILRFKNALFTSCVIWSIYICLSRRTFLLMIFFLNAVGFGLLFSLIIPGTIYHHGFLYLMIIMTLWMNSDKNRPHKNPAASTFQLIIPYLSYFIFVLLATAQIHMSFSSVEYDLQGEFSSSQRFGKFINGHPEFRNAIILAEPDFFAEAMPYYVNNPIYISREKRFGRSTKFTTENKKDYSLGELLNTAKKLRSVYNQPVVIILGYELNSHGPFAISVLYQRTFTYSKDSLDLFLKHTKKIAEFHQAYGDENYDIYLLH